MIKELGATEFRATNFPPLRRRSELLNLVRLATCNAGRASMIKELGATLFRTTISHHCDEGPKNALFVFSSFAPCSGC